MYLCKGVPVATFFKGHTFALIVNECFAEQWFSKIFQIINQKYK